MFKQGISEETSGDLAVLGKSSFLEKFYLAGGTAVALRLGHRLSFDLDFFTISPFDQTSLSKSLRKLGKFRREQIAEDTLLGVFGKTKISFFRYDEPLIGKTERFLDVRIVSLADLSAMKIDAISRRGTKRDFIDLYFIGKRIGLDKAFLNYKKKYGRKDINIFHAIKAMNYFVDAEDEDMPEMLVDCGWEEVKGFFNKEVPGILKRWVKKPVDEVITKAGKESFYVKLAEDTQGAWAGDDWDKTRKKRKKIELAASNRRKLELA